MNIGIDFQNPSSWFEPHACSRTDAYVLLASLLVSPPTPALLDLLGHLSWNPDIPEKVDKALTALQEACANCSPESITEDFQRLFVGLGSGDLVPYSSWYREKKIQSAPLAAIRADLMRLGIVRCAECWESEDHFGVLCEIMALLSKPENKVSIDEQAFFFNRHVDPCMIHFFMDLQAVKKAVFYRKVGTFGSCFLEAEGDFLKSAAAEMDSNR